MNSTATNCAYLGEDIFVSSSGLVSRATRLEVCVRTRRITSTWSRFNLISFISTGQARNENLFRNRAVGETANVAKKRQVGL